MKSIEELTERDWSRCVDDLVDELEERGRLIVYDSDLDESPFEFYAEFFDAVDQQLFDDAFGVAELHLDGEPMDRETPLEMRVDIPGGETVERQTHDSDSVATKPWVELLNGVLAHLSSNQAVCHVWHYDWFDQEAALVAGTFMELHQLARAGLPMQFGPGVDRDAWLAMRAVDPGDYQSFDPPNGSYNGVSRRGDEREMLHVEPLPTEADLRRFSIERVDDSLSPSEGLGLYLATGLDQDWGPQRNWHFQGEDANSSDTWMFRYGDVARDMP